MVKQTPACDGNKADIWLTRDEIAVFLSKIPSQHRQFRNLFKFRILTGARPEEAQLFGKNNVDWSRGEIWIETVKVRKTEGAAPPPHSIEHYLAAASHMEPTDSIFYAEQMADGGAISRVLLIGTMGPDWTGAIGPCYFCDSSLY